MKKVLMVILCLFMIAGCSGTKSSSSSDSYKIGLDFELTGGVADYGNAELKGATLAIEQANAAAGYEKYTSVQYDTKSDVSEAVSTATSLVQDKVVGVVGPATSGASAAGYQIFNDAKVLVISPSATANNITLTNPDDSTSAVYDYVFRACFEDSYQGAAMAQFAIDNLGCKKAIIYGDSTTDYSKGLSASFKKQFEKLDGVVVDSENYVAGDTDFASVLTKIKGMDFDVLYIPGYYSEAGLIIKQARAMGITVPIIGGDGFDSVTLSDLAGNDNLNDVYFTTAYTTINASDSLKAFIDAYKEKYNEDPNMFSALAFDSVNCLIQGIEKAGSSDPEAIQKAVSEIEFDGITGSFTFDAAHTPVKSVLVVKLVDGVQSDAVSVSPKVD